MAGLIDSALDAYDTFSTQEERFDILGELDGTYQTYWGRNIAKKGFDKLTGLDVGGVMSAVAAMDKSNQLKYVAQRHFQNTREYMGEELTPYDVRLAIMYAAKKKGTKGSRNATVSGLKNVAAISGAVAGSVLGSVVPVAGTIAGAASAARVGKGSVDVGYRLFRGLKACYKKIRRTQGVNRKKCANILFGWAMRRENSKNAVAARDALRLLLGAEYRQVMLAEDVDRIVARLAST